MARYFQRKRREKLYRQWVERAGLPPEAVPPLTGRSQDVRPQLNNHEAVSPVPDVTTHPRTDNEVATHPDVTGDMMAEIGKDRPRLPLLYLLFGISLLVLCVGLILLIVHSC